MGAFDSRIDGFQGRQAAVVSDLQRSTSAVPPPNKSVTVWRIELIARFD